MADSPEIFDRWIEQLNTLGNIAEDVAPEVARTVEAEFQKQIAAGMGPDGQPLRPTKDGKQPLRSAAKALTVSTRGTVVLMQLSGHIARHHYGRVKGKVKRPLLPVNGTLSPTVSAAIGKVVEKRFGKVMGDG